MEIGRLSRYLRLIFARLCDSSSSYAGPTPFIFVAPVAVAVHDCCLYVVDSGAVALRLVDLNLRRVTTLARAASGKEYWRPMDLALDAPSGRLYFTSAEDAVARWLDLKSGRIHVLPDMLAPSRHRVFLWRATHSGQPHGEVIWYVATCRRGIAPRSGYMMSRTLGSRYSAYRR